MNSMLKHTFLTVLGVGLLCVATVGNGQDTTSGYAAARDFVDLAFTKATVEQAIQIAIDFMTQADPTWKQYEDVFGAILSEVFLRADFKEAIARVYADEFTESELVAMIDFYKSKSGKKLAEKMPELQGKIRLAVAGFIKEHYAELAEAIQKYGPEMIQVPGDANATSLQRADDDSLVMRNVRTMLSHGKSFLRQGKYPYALKFLQAADAFAPSDRAVHQELHYFLGRTYGSLSVPDGRMIPDANLYYTTKAVENFQRVIEIAPTYSGETVLLDPYSRITSEWGAMAMAYASRRDRDSILWALHTGKSSGGFMDAQVEYCRNVMASCEKNAVLLVNGDMDTFPTLYLQVVDGYRPDITVVNVSLLNAPWYAKQIIQKYPYGTNNLPSGLIEPQIDSLEAEYWEEKSVTLPPPGDPSQAAGAVEWVLKPPATFQGRGIIRVQDKILLNALETNAWKRPVYFSTTLERNNLMSLEEFLSFEGLVYRLLPHRAKGLPLSTLQDNLLRKYSYRSLRGKEVSNSTDFLGVYKNYCVAFSRLASEFIEQGKRTEATALLAGMDERIIPLTAHAYATRGSMKKGLSRYEEALQDFDTSLTMDHESVYALCERGDLRRRLQRPLDAMGEYEDAIRVDSTSEYAHEKLAEVLRDLGRYQESLRESAVTIHLDTAWAFPYSARATTEWFMGKEKEAEADWRRAARLDTSAVSPFGQYLFSKGKYEDAANIFRQSTQAGESQYATLWLFFSEWFTIGPDSAKLHLESSLEQRAMAEEEFVDVLAGFLLGDLSSEKLLEEARVLRNQTIRENLCEAYFYIGMKYFLHGDRDNARVYWKRCVETGVTNYLEYHYAYVALKER
jgi:tetratricopeptide (TPR) repeat protein